MTQQQVQQEAIRLSNSHQLGLLQKEYGKWEVGCALVFHALFTLMALCLTFFFLSIFFFFRTFGPFGLLLGIFGLCIPSILFFIGCAAFVRVYHFRHSRNFLYEHGFLSVKYAGKQIIASEAIHWREIAIIWHRVERSTSTSTSSSGSSSTSTTITHLYTFQRWDGTLFGSRLGNHEGSTLFGSRLGKHIEQMMLPSLLPQAISLYQQGFPVHFGPLALHTGGITYQGRVLPWSDFDRLTMSENYGRLSLLQKSGQRFLGFKKPWATLSYHQVPNLAVLHRLILTLTGSAHP